MGRINFQMKFGMDSQKVEEPNSSFGEFKLFTKSNQIYSEIGYFGIKKGRGPEAVYIAPPNVNIESDNNSGDEDGSGLVDNLNTHQLQFIAEAVCAKDRRNNKHTETKESKNYLYDHLSSLNYGATGTIRENRIPKNCPLNESRISKKEARGSTDNLLDFKHFKMCLIRWKDKSGALCCPIRKASWTMCFEGLQISALTMLCQSECIYCPSDYVNSKNNEKTMQVGKYYAHYNCLLFAYGHKCVDNKQHFSPLKNLKEATPFDLEKEKGATVKCCSELCEKIYHLVCGITNQGLHQYFDQYRSFCRDHRLFQYSPDIGKKENVKCSYCTGIVKLNDQCTAMKSSCCEDTWFHRTCVQNTKLPEDILNSDVNSSSQNSSVSVGANEKTTSYLLENSNILENSNERTSEKRKQCFYAESSKLLKVDLTVIKALEDLERSPNTDISEENIIDTPSSSTLHVEVQASNTNLVKNLTINHNAIESSSSRVELQKLKPGEIRTSEKKPTFSQSYARLITKMILIFIDKIRYNIYGRSNK
ncbi:G2/M phase-specific E3 ubiquitin-protein ligase [Nymphon striatum]|nr:G2/M phase-specific E3 ubiquitin-protein ligase [Nymphon striatum]